MCYATQRYVQIISLSGFDRDHETVAFDLSRAVPTLREFAKYLIESLLITPVKSASIQVSSRRTALAVSQPISPIPAAAAPEN